MITTALGSRLRQARKAKGLTQEQLAEMLHVTRQTVSNWENDRYQPDYDTLAQLADVLSLTEPAPLQPDDAVHGQDADVPISAASTMAAASDADGPVSAATAYADSRHPTRRVILLPLLIGAVLLLAGLTAFALGMKPAATDDEGYTLAWFMREQINEPGKAFVRLYTHESTLKAARRPWPRPCGTPPSS